MEPRCNKNRTKNGRVDTYYITFTLLRTINNAVSDSTDVVGLQ